MPTDWGAGITGFTQGLASGFAQGQRMKAKRDREKEKEEEEKKRKESDKTLLRMYGVTDPGLIKMVDEGIDVRHIVSVDRERKAQQAKIDKDAAEKAAQKAAVPGKVARQWMAASKAYDTGAKAAQLAGGKPDSTYARQVGLKAAAETLPSERKPWTPTEAMLGRMEGFPEKPPVEIKLTFGEQQRLAAVAQQEETEAQTAAIWEQYAQPWATIDNLIDATDNVNEKEYLTYLKNTYAAPMTSGMTGQTMKRPLSYQDMIDLNRLAAKIQGNKTPYLFSLDDAKTMAKARVGAKYKQTIQERMSGKNRDAEEQQIDNEIQMLQQLIQSLMQGITP